MDQGSELASNSSNRTIPNTYRSCCRTDVRAVILSAERHLKLDRHTHANHIVERGDRHRAAAAHRNPYTADEGATTERPQPTDTPYAEGRTIHPTELQVGDCFSFNNNDSSTQVSDVEVVDCSAPHLYEVYSNYQIPQSTFPDENTMKSEQYTACHDTFETYVGIPYDQSQYDATTLTPTENSWAQGDHAITCFLMSKDGSQLTGSLKGAAK